ncbi:DUF4241 domain-containing protein [Paenibacillus glacialis]|uniref:Cytoplasmic protein n=1 Tax=Paenibacillus glacialis TaxID=494026 RepID=A0A168N1K0_9BACL|nr:DUF4241 domain-containing protein [Paenibacillus glacialis]OAB45290.1 cytoplasmic protein [Paenibacillus glacialis]
MSNLLLELAKPESGILRPETLEQITIVSGKMVACDPLISHNHPFERTIQSGKYPVVAWWHKEEERIAAAELKLSDTRPIRWEMAVRPGQNVNELKDGSIFGYPVDTGLGCFGDVEAIDKLDEMEARLQRDLGDDFISLYDNLIEDVLSERDDNWGSVIVCEDTGLNVVMFSSGYGDGFYASYWGFDADDNVVCLVTDFNVLS